MHTFRVLVLAIGAALLASCAAYRERLVSTCTSNFSADGPWSLVHDPPADAPLMRKAAQNGAEGKFEKPLPYEHWLTSTSGDIVLCQVFEPDGCGLSIAYFPAGSRNFEDEKSFIVVCVE